MATEPFTTCLWFDTQAEEAAQRVGPRPPEAASGVGQETAGRPGLRVA